MNNTLKTTAIIVITLISSNLALALPAPPAPPAPPPLYLPPPYAPPPVLPAPPSFAPAAADSIMTLPPTESMGYTATTMPKNFANKGFKFFLPFMDSAKKAADGTNPPSLEPFVAAASPGTFLGPEEPQPA